MDVEDPPLLLMIHPHLGPMAEALERSYGVLRLWSDPPPDATALARVRAIVVAGEYPLDAALIDRMPNLGLIACFTSGYDGIDVGWARERGLQITHAPGVNQEDVADHAIGLIIGWLRGIVTGDRTVRTGGWTPGLKMTTPSLAGRRVGVVGLGGIGRAVARRCEVMRMPVAWWGPRPQPDAPWPRADSLMSLARDSDILVVASRADAGNRGLISREVIAALGPEGLLVNVARGQLVDEDALIAALKAGALGGAALDVFCEEPTPAARWVGVPNTLLTPHTAGATQAAVRGMAYLLMANLEAFFAGEPLRTPVEA